MKWEQIHVIDFKTVLYKGENLCDFLFAFLHTKHLLKMGLL